MIYAAGTFVFVFFLVIKSIIYSKFSSQASYVIMEKLIWNILRRKVEFFDTTPSGVIVNRCTQDVEVSDRKYPYFMSDALDRLLYMIGVFTLAIVVSPFTLVVIVFDLAIFTKHIKMFLTSSTELRRL